MRLYRGIIFLSCVLVSIVLPAPVNITESGDSAVITFSVTASTDAEVGVLDKDGKVIRHLAQGVLGGTYPPPAPLQNSLSQRIVWDGLDDYGKISLEHPFSIRVRTGVIPKFERSIATNVFGTTRTYGPGNVNPTETYLSRSHPLFTPDSELYGEDNPIDFTVSDETDEIFVSHSRQNMSNATWQGWSHLARFNGRTGANLGIMSNFSFSNISCIKIGWNEPLTSWDGRNLYFIECNYTACDTTGRTPQNHVIRFNMDGSQAPWTTTGLNYVSGFYTGDNASRGFTTGPDNNLYVAHYAGGWTNTSCPTCSAAVGKLPVSNYVIPYGITRVSEGRIVQPNKVVVYAPISGVRVDLKGNIYVAARVKPHDKPVPDFVRPESLSGNYWTRWSQAFWADEMYGSILKFDSTGGQMTVFDSDGVTLASRKKIGDFEGGNGRTLREPYVMRAGDGVRAAGGFQWLHYGVSHVQTRTSWRGVCFCNQMRFDVDRFGRVIYPNTFMHEFCAIDNNRNELFRFKNRDIPEVAIGYGHEIEATDKGLYIADFYNNQIVCFGWKAETETTITLVSAGSESGQAGHTTGLTVYPNPFSPSVRLGFAMNSRQFVSVRILEPSGRTVRILETGVREAGARTVTWNCRDDQGRTVSAGIYLVSVQTGIQALNRKILKVR